MSVFVQLKERNVLRVGMAYVVSAWLVIQVVETIFPAFGFGDAAVRIATIVLGIGLIPVLVFAWAFELTPEGLKREQDVDRSESIAAQTGKTLDRVIMVVLALALGYFAFDKFVLSERREAAIAEQARQEARSETLLGSHGDNSIAVLAFANRSSDPEDAYFADGLADELLSVLARVRELKVASRTSSFYFKDKKVDISEIGSRLGVGNVLSGSVRRNGDRIRVTVTLDETAGDVVLWSQSYDRQIEDLLDIQIEIAHSVATAIVPVLSPESQLLVSARPTENPTAYDYYLQGRDLLRMPPEPSTVASANELFDLAISLDPRFARAYAGRCTAHLATYRFAKTTGSFEAAEAACHRALTLDHGAYEVRTALGNLYRISGQYDKAIAAYEAGLAQQPNAASLYVGLARAYDGLARPEQAEEMFFRAEELEGGYWLVHNELGTFYGSQGRFDEAIERFRRVIELTPESGIGYDNLGNTYLSMGKLAEARTAFEESPAPSRWTYENRALVYYYLGEFANAVEEQKRAVEIAPENHRTWGNLGDAYRLLGEEKNARDAYEKGIEFAERALTVNPDDPDTIARLGMYLAYTGRAERAETEIQRVIDSGHSGVYYWAARVKMHHGDVETAYEYLRKVIDGGWSRSLVARDPDWVALGGEEAFGRL